MHSGDSTSSRVRIAKADHAADSFFEDYSTHELRYSCETGAMGTVNQTISFLLVAGALP